MRAVVLFILFASIVATVVGQVAPVHVCGDGFLSPLYEECDDGNTNNGDGCSAECLIEVVPCENCRAIFEVSSFTSLDTISGIATWVKPGSFSTRLILSGEFTLPDSGIVNLNVQYPGGELAQLTIQGAPNESLFEISIPFIMEAANVAGVDIGTDYPWSIDGFQVLAHNEWIFSLESTSGPKVAISPVGGFYQGPPPVITFRPV